MEALINAIFKYSIDTAQSKRTLLSSNHMSFCRYLIFLEGRRVGLLMYYYFFIFFLVVEWKTATTTLSTL